MAGGSEVPNAIRALNQRLGLPNGLAAMGVQHRPIKIERNLAKQNDMRAQGVDLVYKQNPPVSLMNGAALHPLVGWRLQSPGLEGIMANVS